MIGDTAIVGAGIAGLVCARQLAGAGVGVTLFDKSRGPSGRLSTRRRDGRHWDHGAPFFEARHPDFQAACRGWAQVGVVARWGPPDCWVGLPRMSALGRHLSNGLELRTSCRIGRLVPTAGGVALVDTAGAEQGCFERVVVAVPAPQAVALLESVPTLQQVAKDAVMVPMHALLLELPGPLDGVAELVRPSTGPLSVLVRNAAKPGRPAGECWVAHTTLAWTQAHLERDPVGLQDDLVAAFCEAVGQSVTPMTAQVHRWRYARAPQQGAWADGFGLGPGHRIGVCGDWCAGGGVEAAWRSGDQLAQKLLSMEASSWP